MSKILAALSCCSMAACFLGGVLTIAAYGVLSALPASAPTPPVTPKAPTPATPKPTPPAKPNPSPKPQPRNPRSPH